MAVKVVNYFGSVDNLVVTSSSCSYTKSTVEVTDVLYRSVISASLSSFINSHGKSE